MEPSSAWPRRDQPPSYELDVVVRVTDTLKGPHRDSIEFNEVDRSPSQLDVQQRFFTKWMTAGRPFWWFFRSNERYASDATAPDARHPLTARSEPACSRPTGV
jgi:hypothetical protein